MRGRCHRKPFRTELSVFDAKSGIDAKVKSETNQNKNEKNGQRE